MSGETDLRRLIAGMRPALDPERYVFVALAPGESAPDAPALMRFREEEGETLILRAADAVGLRAEFPCRRITLRVHSALEAVGFLAAVARALTEAGISVNPVAAFHHDHLFAPEDRAEEAMAVLERMAAGA